MQHRDDQTKPPVENTLPQVETAKGTVRYVTTIEREVSNVTIVQRQEWVGKTSEWDTTDGIEIDRDVDDAEVVSEQESTEEEIATAQEVKAIQESLGMTKAEFELLVALVSDKIRYYRSQLTMKVGRDEAYQRLGQLTVLKSKLETGIVHG